MLLWEVDDEIAVALWQRDNRVIRGQVGLVAFDRVVSSLLWIVWWDVMARS